MDYSYLNFNPARPSQRTNFLLTDFASEYTDLERKSLGTQIMSLDQKKISQNIKESEFDKKQPHNITYKIGYYLHLNNPKEWVFIIFFSIITSLFLVFLDKLILVSFQKRKFWSNTEYPLLNYFIWVITSIFFILCATSVGYFISPDADGSGIPEMKTVLSGVPIYRYFSFNAFVGKSLGIFAAIVSGASVGKVGPYVHLSCLICTRLMKSNYFEKIDKSTSMKSTMLSVACATGITFALGCPLGGVLFSIESTASIYMVSNLWKSFFSSVICCFITKIFSGEFNIKVVDDTTAMNVNFLFKLINFIIIGLITGTIGASCATLVSKGVYIRKKINISWLNNRFKFAAITAIITSSVTFFIPGLKNFDKPIMLHLFSANDKSIQDDWQHPGEGWYLLLSCFSKYFLTVLGLSCTMPSGVFGPMFTVGALLGRFYGHLIYSIFGINMESAFAMAASAGAFSGFSHTISSALMVFELAGQTKYLPYLLITCLIANLIGQGLSMGIFDVLLAIKNLPYLPAIKSNDSYSLSAGDLMNKIDFVLYMGKSKIVDGLNILSQIPKKYVVTIPILDEKGIIKKTITAQDLYLFLYDKYNIIKKNYTYKIQNYFNEFFRFSKKKIFSEKRNLFNHIKYKFKKLYLKLKDKERLILNKNFYQESSMKIISFFEENKEKDKIYLLKTIDFNDKMINCGKSALTIDKEFPLLKIQFLFTFLNLSHIFVTDSGKLVGVITKECFINKTKT
jgi:chloride channel 2